MPLRKVSAFQLSNHGGFICDIHCIYFDNDGNRKGDIPNHENFPLGQTKTMDIGAKVPVLQTGDIVQMKVWIRFGSSNTFPAMFQYDPNGEELSFSISGSTLNSHLTLDN